MTSSIIWFRNNLRLHDNKAFYEAIKNSDEVLPIYCFLPYQFQKLSLSGLPKTGCFRTQFLVESVEGLKANLQSLELDLLIRSENITEVLERLKEQFPHIQQIYTQKEFASEELQVEDEVREFCERNNLNIHFFDTNSLYNSEYLPFQIADLPDIFTVFRNRVERESKIEPLSIVPNSLEFFSAKDSINSFKTKLLELDYSQAIPQIDDLIPSELIRTESNKSAIKFAGGESKALKRLNYYLWQSKKVNNYKKTRNGMLGSDYSTKFSAWLANGCLSPRLVYWEIKKFEQQFGSNESTYWVIFELLWREFFRLSTQKYKNKIFQKTGINGKKINENEHDLEKFEQWRLGKTKEDFVNANMKELLNSGFMSNRGRQNVASYLVHDLQLDWRLGAEWFESQLIDYDVYSNWGNWCYVAGVGHDPRSRKFNIQRQSNIYDPDRRYINFWLDTDVQQKCLFTNF
ncbi:MAG: DASH family cryptochrome [Candidatus Caenarcaniphilales bacterium]|nr:DASH family cryptochrome [Candidatus Caenarcaniphilales bacterium]